MSLHKIDIHAYIENVNDKKEITNLLNDMVINDIDKRVVSINNSFDIKKSIDELVSLVKQYPDKLIGCAYINPRLITTKQDIEYALSFKEIKMIEMNSVLDAYAADVDANVELVFQYLQKSDRVLKVFSGVGSFGLPHQWERVSLKYPQVKVVYLHMGCFDYGYSCVDIVNRNTNALIETSNQYELQIMKKAFNEIDISKIIFGTSYPQRLTSNAIDVFDMFDLSNNDLEMIFYKNAKNLLNLD